MKGKQITLYHILGKNLGDEKYTKTSISFTSEEEAKKYCNYLNRTDIDGDTMHFTYKKDKINVFKKAISLINDPNEDSILFSK